VKCGKESKERLDTSALDGLRGLAAIHVAVGHYCAFSDLQQDLSGGQAKFSQVGALGESVVDWYSIQ
jgi:peptidoglycan/LPS O-acetylase OafA/YrhL